MIRIGHGFDVHAFGPPAAGSHIVLGGVHIAHERALLAHSDGDVLLHALSDALLGAAALGDIGQHFPDTSNEWAGADSRDLLRRVMQLLADADWQVNNVDSTIVAQAPKMAPHIPQMRKHISQNCQLPLQAVNVKATTTEKLGYIGRAEGVAVHAVVTLVPARAVV